MWLSLRGAVNYLDHPGPDHLNLTLWSCPLEKSISFQLQISRSHICYKLCISHLFTLNPRRLKRHDENQSRYLEPGPVLQSRNCPPQVHNLKFPLDSPTS